jgi:hypothetical protein
VTVIVEALNLPRSPLMKFCQSGRWMSVNRLLP